MLRSPQLCCAPVNTALLQSSVWLLRLQILVTLLEPIQTAGSAGCEGSVTAAAAAVVDDIVSKCKQLGVCFASPMRWMVLLQTQVMHGIAARAMLRRFRRRSPMILWPKTSWQCRCLCALCTAQRNSLRVLVHTNAPANVTAQHNTVAYALTAANWRQGQPCQMLYCC